MLLLQLREFLLTPQLQLISSGDLDTSFSWRFMSSTQLMTAASATARVHAGLATAALSPAEDPAEEPWSHCITISLMQ